MIRQKLFFFLFFIANFIFYPLASAADLNAFSGQINTDNINVRADATTGSAVICQLAKGEPVEVVSEAYGWHKIRLPKKAPAFVKKDLVECIDSNPDSGAKKCLSAKVIKDRINIRTEPNESSWITGKADKLTILTILTEENGWYKIQPTYQCYGWVNKKFISKENALPKAQEKTTSVEESIKPEGFLSIEGTIRPYGIVLWRKATHKLITPDNNIYFLKGDRKNLNSLNYHKVKVTGRFIDPGSSKHPIIQINMIEAVN